MASLLSFFPEKKTPFFFNNIKLGYFKGLFVWQRGIGSRAGGLKECIGAGETPLAEKRRSPH